MYYCDDECLRQPDGKQVLWRYLDLWKFDSLLETRALYFCNVTTLPDPHEGVVPAHVFDQMKQIQVDEASGKLAPNSFENMKSTLRISMDHFRKGWFVNCWHMNDHEAEAMWKLYLKDAKTGVAIKTTFQHLVVSLHNTRQGICGGIVNYIDHDIDTVPMGDIRIVALSKMACYSLEREFRLLHQEIKGNYDKVINGVNIPVDCGTLIEGVYIAPNAEANVVSRVVELCKEHSLPAPIPSRIYARPSW